MYGLYGLEPRYRKSCQNSNFKDSQNGSIGKQEGVRPRPPEECGTRLADINSHYITQAPTSSNRLLHGQNIRDLLNIESEELTRLYRSPVKQSQLTACISQQDDTAVRYGRRFVNGSRYQELTSSRRMKTSREGSALSSIFDRMDGGLSRGLRSNSRGKLQLIKLKFIFSR